jgi:hypothetical protein
MDRNQQGSMGGPIILFFVLLNVIVLEHGLVSQPQLYKAAYLTVPLLIVSIAISKSKRLQKMIRRMYSN